ncbi:PTS sugar transporter subunit IIB [Paratissierella segnis]|uniref:PTS sugar transporter subunit IIB n=1 Tax=Paratissierella segnis TaxID=2763679 RepID=A0A926EZI5_9FIRM|nr:PTS sugar transporter subunit IIB [Paratissierella segnis]MBC8589164.1 PTS sugar transporter subunit IIB [Paratissierella segnis]
MLNISMVRVDERLIHGQIIIKWIEATKADRIIVIDNDAAFDPVLGKILRMSTPNGIKLEIYNLEDGIKVLLTQENDDVIILAKHLWIVKKIYEGGVSIKEVNVGRIPSDEGRKKICSNVFLSDEDMDIIKYFNKEGVNVFVQIVPDSIPIDLYGLISL